MTNTCSNNGKELLLIQNYINTVTVLTSEQ